MRGEPAAPCPHWRSPQLNVTPTAAPQGEMGQRQHACSARAGGQRGFLWGPTTTAGLPRGRHTLGQGATGQQSGKRPAKTALIISAPCLASLSTPPQNGGDGYHRGGGGKGKKILVKSSLPTFWLVIGDLSCESVLTASDMLWLISSLPTSDFCSFPVNSLGKQGFAWGDTLKADTNPGLQGN